MKLNYLFVAIITVLFYSCTGDYKPLFNGTDLSGWEVQGDGKWYIENGELIGESGEGEQNGYLSTIRDYHDFELQFEFFPEMMHNNSGVFFRSKIEGSEVLGWKVEIGADEHGTGSIYEQNGRGWLKQISEQDQSALKMGQWNSMKIKVVGGTVTTWLNDEFMVTLSDEKIADGNGFIAFQIHKGGGVRMRWRKVKIKELDKLEKVNQYF